MGALSCYLDALHSPLWEAAMKRERHALHLISDIMDAITKTNVSRALRQIAELETRFSDTTNFLINGPACLIETGQISGDSELVRRGIELGDKALQMLPEDSEYRGMLHFNIGNGYYCLFGSDRQSDRTIDYYDYLPLHKAKTHFRRAIESNAITDNLKKQAMVNLANVYDSLGRTVESIHLYERVLATEESFAMAQANLGQALAGFAAICGEYQAATLAQAYHLISDALSRRSHLLKIGGAAAVEYFERQVKEIVARFPDPSVLSKPNLHPPLKTSRLTKREQEYYRFCHENRLFLNFHIHVSEVLCRASVVDNIMFSLIERPTSQGRFVHLAKYINQIKEDFATARYLLFLSMHKRPHTTRISQLTKFVDTLDYTENSLYLGMAKAAFGRAYSILDKIGAFLNAYLDLETKGHVYFRNIWARKTAGGWEVKETIRQNKKQTLLGLYDVNRDFQTREYEDIRAIRNALVHDRLSLVDEFSLNLCDPHAEERVVSIDRFKERTIDLLLIVKSCISNLVSFVNREEQDKAPGDGLVLPVFYPQQRN